MTRSAFFAEEFHRTNEILDEVRVDLDAAVIQEHQQPAARRFSPSRERGETRERCSSRTPKAFTSGADPRIAIAGGSPRIFSSIA